MFSDENDENSFNIYTKDNSKTNTTKNSGYSTKANSKLSDNISSDNHSSSKSKDNRELKNIKDQHN